MAFLSVPAEWLAFKLSFWMIRIRFRPKLLGITPIWCLMPKWLSFLKLLDTELEIGLGIQYLPSCKQVSCAHLSSLVYFGKSVQQFGVTGVKNIKQKQIVCVWGCV